MRWAVIACVALCLVLGAISARDLRARVGLPHAGFAVFHNGMVGPPLAVPTRLAANAPMLRPQDRVVAIDGRPIRGGPDVWAAVDAAGPGVVLHYEIERGGERFDAAIPTGILTRRDQLELALPVLLGALLLLGLGAAPILVNPHLPYARVFFGFALGASGAFGFTAFDNFVGYRFVPWSLGFIALAKAGFLHMALGFPAPMAVLRRWPRALPIAIYGAMAIQGAANGFVYDRAPELTTPFAHLAVATLALAVVLLTVNLVRTARSHPDARMRQQARIVLPGPLIGVFSGALLFATTWGVLDMQVPMAVQLLPLWASFLAVSYAILRSNLFEFDAVMRRGLAMTAILLGAAALYLGLFVAVHSLVGSGAAWIAAAAAIALLMVLVPSFAPLRQALERRVGDWLDPGGRQAAEMLREAGAAAATTRSPAELAALLRDALERAFAPARLHVVTGRREEALGEPDRPDAEPLAASSPIAIALRRELVVNVDDGEPPARDPRRPARRELMQRDLHLLVPFPGGRAEGSGGFLLGARADGRFYNHEDVERLEILAAHAALAFDNARAFEALRELQGNLRGENVALREQLEQRVGFDELIGRSSAIQAALAQIEQVAPTDASVLVLGETGTGKELVARALHRLSARRERPLVKVACGAVPETLLESEFFGHERGAFTGANRRRLGRLEAADGGTLFLDDVDALPLAVQAKLLRAIQEGEVQRLGSPRVSRVDVRIVAASNQDLEQLVQRGEFRQDLYYRLAVVPIRIPPLRERAEDIPLLVQHFVVEESRRLGLGERPVAREFLDAALAHDWPGNVRELRNAVQRAVVMSRGDAIGTPPRQPAVAEPAAAAAAAGGATPRLDGRQLAEVLREHKIERIRAALRAAGGNQRRAAEALGLHRQSLGRMMRELGLSAPAAPAAAAGRAQP